MNIKNSDYIFIDTNQEIEWSGQVEWDLKILVRQSGEIVMVPDFDNYVIKLIISGGGSRLSTEIPILENVENREYYGRTATEIKMS